jgi:hypothetical protein
MKNMSVAQFTTIHDIFSNQIYINDVRRWLRTMEWRKRIGNSNNELSNILERYILSELNYDGEAKNKAIQEARDKKIDYPVSELLEYQAPYTDIYAKIDNDQLILNELTTVMTERMKLIYNLLIKLLSDYHKDTNLAVQLLAWLWIADDSLMPGGQQWGIAWNVAEYLHEHNFGEGFCSPFNSRMFDFQTNPIFHSLMDIDAILGSRGSVMNAKLHQGKMNWFLNPPYIEKILMQTVELIIRSCRHKKGKIYTMFMPLWKDSQAFLLAKSCKYLKKLMIFEAGQFVYQDCNKQFIQPGKSGLIFFIFGDSLCRLPEEFAEDICNRIKNYKSLTD